MSEKKDTSDFDLKIKTASDAVTSKQEKTIKSLKVYGSYKDIFHNNAKVVKEAFENHEDMTNYSPELNLAVERLKISTPTRSEVRYVKLDGFPYLVRRTELVKGRLIRTEVFSAPNITVKQSPDYSELLCNLCLVQDLSTGKIANISEASYFGAPYWVRVGSEEQYNSSYDHGRGGSTISESFLSEKNELKESSPLDKPLRNSTNFVNLHESGHSFQQEIDELEYDNQEPVFSGGKIKKAVKQGINSVVNFIVYGSINPPPSEEMSKIDIRVERNASAYALAVIRKYKSLGVDLSPNVTNTELIDLVNHCLSSRYEDMRIKEKYTKMKKFGDS